MSVHFENSQPILRVEEMARALSFYVDLLGFENADWGDEEFTNISGMRRRSICPRAIRARAKPGSGLALDRRAEAS